MQALRSHSDQRKCNRNAIKYHLVLIFESGSETTVAVRAALLAALKIDTAERQSAASAKGYKRLSDVIIFAVGCQWAGH